MMMNTCGELAHWYLAEHRVRLDDKLHEELVRRLTTPKVGARNSARLAPFTLVRWFFEHNTSIHTITRLETIDAVDGAVCTLARWDRLAIRHLGEHCTEASMTRNLGFGGDVALGLVTVGQHPFIIANVRSIETAATVAVLYVDADRQRFSLYVPTDGNGFVDGKPLGGLAEPTTDMRRLMFDVVDHING